MKNYVGIDVSKDTLAVAFPLTADAWKVSTYANSPEGIRRLKGALPQQTHVIIEATAAADRRLILRFTYLSALSSQRMPLRY